MRTVYTLEMVEKEGREIFGDKYQYIELLRIDGRLHVHLICNDCGYDFNQIIRSHLKLKCKCSSCAGNLAFTLDQVKQKGVEIHGDKFDYIKIVKEPNKDRMIKLKCKDCGHEFSPTLDNFLNKKSGCIICYGNNPYIFEDIVEQSKLIHGDKYEYIKFIKDEGKDMKIEIKCKECNNISTPYVYGHINNAYGCKLCQPKSKGENALEKYFIDHNIVYEREKKFEGCVYKRELRFDFYLPVHNTVIEYNGQQHYRAYELYGGDEALAITQERDQIKIDYCKANKIEMLIIPYNEINNIENILLRNLIY